MTEAIADIVGGAHVRPAEPADAVRGVMPSMVVEPGDAQALARVLASADAQGLAVAPRGGGTKGAWGNPPGRLDVVLSTRRLDRVVEHPWADLTVTVQAGCTIRTLQETLEPHGQRIAVDPLWPDRATVGGVLSANDSGALRLRFGGLRDLVIGTTIALADGTLASSGGKVVKNVAGYDLSKLATGALGTLGIITSAIFRLHPRPQHARTLSAPTASVDDAQRLMLAWQDSKLAHSSLQLRVSRSVSPVVDVLFEGTPAGIEAQVLQAQSLAKPASLEPSPTDVWHAREDLWRTSEAGLILKVAIVIGDVPRLLDVIRRLADSAQREWAAVFQATGLGWVRFGAAAGGSSDVVRQLRAAVGAKGGAITVLRSDAVDHAIERWGDVGDALPLMQTVKQRFDPKGTLNPGRFVGGI